MKGELVFIDCLLCAEFLPGLGGKSGLWFLETHMIASTGKCDIYNHESVVAQDRKDLPRNSPGQFMIDMRFETRSL